MAAKIKKILFATDLSKNSAYTFSYAINLAQVHGATIVILHAIEPLPAVALFHGTRDEETHYYEKMKGDREGRIKEFVEFCCRDVENRIGEPCNHFISRIICPVGHPLEEILGTADEEECDLIVVGSHGKGFLRHNFLGSVSRSVLDRSTKPVLVVPLPLEDVTSSKP